MRRADIEKVKHILGEVQPEQLLELLQWEGKHRDGGMRAALDCCVENRDEDCVLTIVEHAITTRDVSLLTAVFPYVAIVKDTNLISKILKTVPEASTELLQSLLHKSRQTNGIFRKCDKGFYECILKDILDYTTKRKDNHDGDLTHMTPLQVYLLLASVENRSGLSSFHNEELIPIHLEILDKCMEYLTANYKDQSVSSIFPAFDFIHAGVPYKEASTSHPLVLIGEADHMALMKHPYIATYVDVCWIFGARYPFYFTIFFYMMFLLAFSTFITCHDVDNPGTDTSFKTSNPIFSYVCAYSTIVFAAFLLVIEFLQARTKKKDYCKVAENLSDLVIVIGSMLLTILSIAIEYNSWTHSIGCLLIVIATIRGALILTYMPIVGHKFRMLLAVSMNVVKFLPVLAFFITAFAVVFKNLLQNHDAFDHVGIAIVKTMAMAIGELDFGDIFLDESNIKIHEVFAFIVFVLFLGIMTVSMMNLLIGIAVGDIGELSKHSEQEAFRSKVDLMLLHHYMYPKHSMTLHQRPIKFRSLKQFIKEDATEYPWYTWIVGVLLIVIVGPFWLWCVYTEAAFQKKFFSYKDRLEKEYKTKPDIEQVKEELSAIRIHMDRITKQNEKIMQLVSEVNGSNDTFVGDLK